MDTEIDTALGMLYSACNEDPQELIELLLQSAVAAVLMAELEKDYKFVLEDGKKRYTVSIKEEEL